MKRTFFLTFLFGWIIYLSFPILAQTGVIFGPDTANYKRYLQKVVSLGYNATSPGLSYNNSVTYFGYDGSYYMYRAYFQWSINYNNIPKNSTIDSVVVFFIYDQVNTGYYATVNYFNPNVTIVNPNLDSLWNQANWTEEQSIGSGRGNKVGTQNGNPTDTVRSVFYKGSTFANSVYNSLNSGQFVLGVVGDEADTREFDILDYSVTLQIYYTLPQQVVTVDQKLANGTSADSVAHYEGSSFVPYAVPHQFSLPITTTQYFRADTNTVYQSSIYQKFLDWNTDHTNGKNYKDFYIDTTVNSITAWLDTTANTQIQNTVDGTSIVNSTTVQFSDPWLRDTTAALGLRNRGTTAVYYTKTAPFAPNTNTNYKGVLLNQRYDVPGYSYYKVGFASGQSVYIGSRTHNLYFQNWTTSGATVQSTTSTQTGVVFNIPNSTVQANVKGAQLSGDNSAFADNSQRKCVETTDNVLHTVYSSMGHVWYETSTNGGSTWNIMNNGMPLDNGGGKCPSLDYNGNYVAIVFQQQGSGSTTYTIQLQTYYLINNVYVFGTSASIYSEYNDAYSINANPNIAWGDNDKFIVTYERKDNTNPLLPYGINYTYGFASYNIITKDGSGWISGTNNNSVNASVYSNKSDNNYGFQVAYEQDNYLKYIYYCRINVSATWNITTTAVSNISSGDGYYINYHPSIIGMPDGTAKACWIGDYTGTGSMVNVISRDLSQSNSFFSNGSNVKSASINLTNDNTNCYFSWSNYGGGTSYTNQFANISTPFINKTLNTNGQDVQLSNGAAASNLFVSAYYPFTAPYYFITSSNLGSFPKTNPNAIGIGKGVVVVKGEAQFSYFLGDIVVDNKKINFVKVSDTTNNNNINNINATIETEPFTLSDNSNFEFSDMTGLIDSAAALSVLGNNGYIIFKVELIDNATGATVGTLSNVNITSSNLSSCSTSSYKVNTNGLGGRIVIARLTVSTNLDKPEFFVIGRYSTDGNVIGKSSDATKEISVMDNGIVKTYGLDQNYPNPFNPTTVINYQIPKDGFVSVKVFDALGREIKTLVSGYKTQGKYSISFDASNLSSGVYFYQITAGDFTSIKKMMLLK